MSVPEANIPEVRIDETTRPYWSALAEGRLMRQHCRACGHDWLPPRPNCAACLADDCEWRDCSGHGRIVSWVVYHKAYAPHLADRVPYNVAIVELAEGPRLLTNIIDSPDGRGLAPGAAVELAIEEDFGRALPRFRLAPAPDA